jgi:molecular chaperone GrpE
MKSDERDAATPLSGEAAPADEAIVASETPETTADSGATALAPVPESPATAEVERLRQERDQLRDSLLRRRAEFENFRRRTERERQSWAAEAEATLVQALIPTLDNLEQALRSEAPDGGMRAGVELIQRELLATLTRLGLAEHDPVGQPFDPLTAQALSHEFVPGVAEGTVTETFRKGYLFKERLLRPAIVKVAKAAEEEAAPSETDPNKVH